MSYIPYILALHYPLRSFSTFIRLSHITSSTTFDQPFAPFVGANKTRVNWHLHLNRVGSSMYTHTDINHIAHLLAHSFIHTFLCFSSNAFFYRRLDMRARYIYPFCTERYILLLFIFILSNFQMSGIEEEKRYNWQIIIVLHNEKLMTGD